MGVNRRARRKGQKKQSQSRPDNFYENMKEVADSTTDPTDPSTPVTGATDPATPSSDQPTQSQQGGEGNSVVSSDRGRT